MTIILECEMAYVKALRGERVEVKLVPPYATSGCAEQAIVRDLVGEDCAATHISTELLLQELANRGSEVTTAACCMGSDVVADLIGLLKDVED